MTEPIILALIGLAASVISNVFVIIKLKMGLDTTHSAIAQVVDQVAEVQKTVHEQPDKQDLRAALQSIRNAS